VLLKSFFPNVLNPFTFYSALLLKELIKQQFDLISYRNWSTLGIWAKTLESFSTTNFNDDIKVFEEALVSVLSNIAESDTIIRRKEKALKFKDTTAQILTSSIFERLHAEVFIFSFYS
jgi:hypothetical protein